MLLYGCIIPYEKKSAIPPSEVIIAPIHHKLAGLIEPARSRRDFLFSGSMVASAMLRLVLPVAVALAIGLRVVVGSISGGL